MKIILLNPWIADFAAYNFWTRPIGLYRVAEWFYERGAEPVLMDCMSGFPAPGKFRREHRELPSGLSLDGMDRHFARYGISDQEFDAQLIKLLPADAVLVTSVMSYWYPGVIWAIERIRKIAGQIPVGLGGIYATLWPKHAASCSGADRIFPGNLESFSNELATWLNLPKDPVRPFRPWYELGLHDNSPFSGIRTATGCPFNCTYCASRLVSGPFRERKWRDILTEITALYSIGVRNFSFYDDALLVNFDKRLGVVLQCLLSSKIMPRFHTPNGLHARLINDQVAELLTANRFQTVRLSLETVNIRRQMETGGKVSAQEVGNAVKLLLSKGMEKKSIGIYLLAGLPGQDISEIETGIRFVKSLGVRPYISEYSPIPGTPEWKKLEQDGIVSSTMDPILTNNTIFYWHLMGLDRERFNQLKKLARQQSL